VSGDIDVKLTGLAAEVWRDAVRGYVAPDGEGSLPRFTPVLPVWTTGVVAGLDVTSSFPAVTRALPALASASPVAASPSLGTSAAPAHRKTSAGPLRALTESFLRIGPEPDRPAVTLKNVFRLPDRLPGVRLPAEPELGTMARSAPTMTRLHTLAQWLGDEGQRVTSAGNLAPDAAADAARLLGVRPATLTLLWEYGLTAGWFELVDSADRRHTWAVPDRTAGRWADGDDRGALHAWAAVFAAVAAGTLDALADADPGAARKLDFVGQGAGLAVTLFLRRRDGMTAADARRFVRDGAVGRHLRSRRRRAWDAWVRKHGDPADQLLAELAELKAVTNLPNGSVELSPLSQWALRQQFAQDKIVVPLLSPMSPRMSGADLVALSDAVSPDELDAAFTTWTQGRDPDQAVRELLIYAGSVDPRGRLTAVGLARRIGGPGYRAWADAMRRDELRGYARVTLSMMAGDLPESALPLVLAPDPDDMTGLAADLLALAYGDGAPDPDDVAARFASAVPAGEEGWVLGLMALSPQPDVADVLDLLADCHPDRRLAREARKAARAQLRNRKALAHRALALPTISRNAGRSPP
jgi:hypothetical protein